MAQQPEAAGYLELLETPFKWRPEQRATKKPKAVLKNATEKLQIDELNSVGYLVLKAYVYTLADTVDYGCAEECLKQAERECQKDRPQFLTCQYAIDATRLCIEQERKLNESELPCRFQELQRRWDRLDDDARAAVFAVKGLALLRFGLTRYEEAAEAYAEANRLTRQTKLIYTFGEANLRARIRRSKGLFTPADEQEVQLWTKARQLSLRAPSKFDRSHFLALNAEALLNNGEPEFCTSLVRDAWNLLKRLAPRELVLRYRGLLKGDKCCKILCKKFEEVNQQESIPQVQRLKEDIYVCFSSVKDRIEKASVLFHFANNLFALKRMLECRRLLERAQMVAKRPGNAFVDCKLIFLKRITKKETRERYTVEDCLAEYDTLIKLYERCSSDVATIKLMKAEYLARCNRTSEAAKVMFHADELDPQCWQRIAKGQIKFIYDHFRDSEESRDEWFAWLLQRAGDRIVKFEPEAETYSPEELYKTVLYREPEKAFALEHLGRLSVSKGDFSEAESHFNKLLSVSDTVKNRRFLAETILRDNSKVPLLRCCELGCKDAGESLLHLLIQEKQEALNAMHSQSWLQLRTADYTMALPQLPHCSKETYEICARVRDLFEQGSGFHVQQPEDEAQLHEHIMSLIEELLELGNSEDGATDRVNALRKARFQATYLLRGNAVKDLNDEVGKTLKEAKESLDRSRRLLPLNCCPKYFAHGFNGLQKELTRIPEVNQIQSRSDLTEDESKQLIQKYLADFILKDRTVVSSERIRDCLKSELRILGSPDFASNPRTKPIFDFLVSRESAILTTEGPWLVHWIYGANREKHEELQKFDALNSLLKSYSKGPRSAYEMAHRAAEFAEETRLAMNCWTRAAATGSLASDTADTERRIEEGSTGSDAEDEETGLSGLFGEACTV